MAKWEAAYDLRRAAHEEPDYSDGADLFDDLADVDVAGELMDIAWDLMDEPTPDNDRM